MIKPYNMTKQTNKNIITILTHIAFVTTIICAIITLIITIGMILIHNGQTETVEYKITTKIPDIYDDSQNLKSLCFKDKLSAPQTFDNISVTVYADEELTREITTWNANDFFPKFKINRKFNETTEVMEVNLTRNELWEINHADAVLPNQHGYGGCYLVVHYDGVSLSDTAYSLRKTILTTREWLHNIFS